MPNEPRSSAITLLAFVTICVAVVGYFVGLQAPMNPGIAKSMDRIPNTDHLPLNTEHRTPNTGEAILATHYADMHLATKSRASTSSLAELRAEFDPMALVEITPEQKMFALQSRELNRAFNGAPPTIPHPIDQMSAASCLACHGEGVKTESLRISKMSHQLLTNCTQCHAENNPSHIPASLFRESSFVGLPAPTGGPRAYDGAPPMIPHSTWMRVDCASCHGFTGQQGIRTTHPWRQNCQQCHAPSSTLDQIQLEPTPAFLSPLEIEK